MKRLDQVLIPRMFSAFAHSEGVRITKGAHHLTVQYFCGECGMQFGAVWQYMGWFGGFQDHTVLCPRCGAKHVNSHSQYVTQHLGENEEGPQDLHLAVYEFKNSILLKATCHTVRFTELLNLMKSNITEEFRFDVQKRKTTFRRKVNGVVIAEFEIGNPFDLAVFNSSILKFVTAASGAKAMSPRITGLLKTLREALQLKLELRCKHKIKSMRTGCGREYGKMLVPLYNMAFRMLFLDAANLPAIYRQRGFKIKRFWDSKFIVRQDLLSYAANRKNCISAIIKDLALPDKCSIRKILQEDIFSFDLLKKAQSFTGNLDRMITIYRLLRQIGESADFRHGEHAVDRVFDFAKAMTEFYGIEGAIQVLRKYTVDAYLVRDTLDMYRRLAVDNKQEFLTSKIKLPDLHDWLVEKIKDQVTKGIDFKVPEHIQKRLLMQKESIKFFLPDKSSDLVAAGAELHNCVGSYSDRMGANLLQIVLVADDLGKLVACLEIRNNQLQQAKLKYNKPVSRDAKINAEVFEWANEAGVIVRGCGDVRAVYLPAIISA